MAQRGHKEKEHCVGRVCNGDVGDMTVGKWSVFMTADMSEI